MSAKLPKQADRYSPFTVAEVIINLQTVLAQKDVEIPKLSFNPTTADGITFVKTTTELAVICPIGKFVISNGDFSGFEIPDEVTRLASKLSKWTKTKKTEDDVKKAIQAQLFGKPCV